MKIFSGVSNIRLAESIAKKCSIPLSPVETHIFPDGERRVRITENVVGESVALVQSANTPVDEHYMELFFILDSLKRSGAEFITAVVPYFGYQRQDHVFRDGEAVSLEVIIKFLESLKIDRFMSFDLHSSRIPSLFSVNVSSLSALPLFTEIIVENKWTASENLLVSPDRGGLHRVEQMSGVLHNMEYAVFDKKRDLQAGSITGDTFSVGNIEGKKRSFIIDDMISSGKTILLAADVLHSKGIDEIYVFATHALFSSDAPQLLQSSCVKKVFVTDTVSIPQEKKFEKLIVLSVAAMIADELQKK